MIAIEGNSVAELLTKVVTLIIKKEHNPKVVNISSPRGKKCYAINDNIALKLTDPMNTVFESETRSTQLEYLSDELHLYFKGTNKVKDFAKASKFWNHLTNPDGTTINSAYGHLLFKDKNEHGFTEFGWAMNSLIKDRDTRQAIIRFNKPTHSFEGNKDFVCTLSGVFAISDNKLNLTINMRSNDIQRGIPFDIPFFCILLQQAHMILVKEYPELKIGTYEHIVNNMHIYDTEYKLYKDIVDKGRKFVNRRCHIDTQLIDKNGKLIVEKFNRKTIDEHLVIT